MREQAVAAAEVDNAAAVKEAPGAARGLPRLVELLARQAARGAHRARQAIEDGIAGETVHVVHRQP